MVPNTMLKKACLLALPLLALLCGPALAQEPPALPPLSDPPSGEQLPGKFVWFDLATPALGEQQAFYQDVFGWTYRAPAQTTDEYVLVLNEGRPIAGMFSFEPPGGEQDGAAWLNLFSVSNLEEAVSAAERSGGSVEVAPLKVPGRGRHALLRDPAEAIFGMIVADGGDPPDRQVPVGDIIWVDLFARDIEAMARFYRSLAPWEIRDRSVTDEITGKLLSAGGQPRAGIVPVDEEANRAAWVPYIRVDDVEATLARVVEGGGFTIIAPDPQILDGQLGVFVDPHGAVVGVVRYEYDNEVAP